MTAIFKGRRGDRVIVQTDHGFFIANAIDDCDFDVGEVVHGVSRDHGTQYWRGAAGNVVEVYVEGFDATAATALRWLHP
ncbi:MAG: hypothetical protein J0I74_08695 [Rhodanobacter sp.]|jgi:hypothetical protein|nr:hypothetical protein [Rhodanobacter sp.]